MLRISCPGLNSNKAGWFCFEFFSSSSNTHIGRFNIEFAIIFFVMKLQIIGVVNAWECCFDQRIIVLHMHRFRVLSGIRNHFHGRRFGSIVRVWDAADQWTTLIRKQSNLELVGSEQHRLVEFSGSGEYVDEVGATRCTMLKISVEEFASFWW